MNKPDAISELQTSALESFRWVSLFSKCTSFTFKGLYNKNSFKYNLALKVTAYTTDRSILFWFHSESFNDPKAFFWKKELNYSIL
jgi:hypothetical protein